MMQRIVVVGSGGSGKSTLAVQAGLALGLEVTHLDSLFWKPGWVRISAAEQEAIAGEVVGRASWIIEGTICGRSRFGLGQRIRSSFWTFRDQFVSGAR